jgi:hypothetical protein
MMVASLKYIILIQIQDPSRAEEQRTGYCGDAWSRPIILITAKHSFEERDD